MQVFWSDKVELTRQLETKLRVLGTVYRMIIVRNAPRDHRITRLRRSAVPGLSDWLLHSLWRPEGPRRGRVDRRRLEALGIAVARTPATAPARNVYWRTSP
jgi:hypothetical protein